MKYPTYRIIRRKYNSEDKTITELGESYTFSEAKKWVKKNFNVSGVFYAREYDAINILNHDGEVIQHFRIKEGGEK
jgi:hypothetical protein